MNEVWKGCSVFTLDTTEKEQVELPVAGGGTSLHSIAKETCQGQGCNAATDRPDGNLIIHFVILTLAI